MSESGKMNGVTVLPPRPTSVCRGRTLSTGLAARLYRRRGTTTTCFVRRYLTALARLLCVRGASDPREMFGSGTQIFWFGWVGPRRPDGLVFVSSVGASNWTLELAVGTASGLAGSANEQ